MYRVLIVDDEPVIRNGITAIIDWEKENVFVQSDCENGVEALNALQNHSFDILITDIIMPIMDGIQLMKQALELNPSLKVILISSYSDYEYVRQGLKLGAVDYLLKAALDPEDLLAVLKRCFSMLDEERVKALELQDSRQSAIFRYRKILEQDFKRMIVEEQSFASTKIMEITWLEASYICAYLVLDGAKEWIEHRGYLYMQLMLEELQELFYDQVEEGIAFLVTGSSMFVLLPDNNNEGEQRLCDWKKSLENKCGISTSIGFTTVRGKGSLLKEFYDSRLALERRFFEGLGGLYKMNDREINNGKPINNREQDWTPFFEMIRNGDPAPFAVEFALKRWANGSLSPEQIREEACNLLLHVGKESVLSEQLDLLRGAETLEQLASLLIDQLEEMGKPYIPKLEDKGSGAQMITKALVYMSARYTENLTLQEVADIVHLSRNYFSLLFKKQTGLNFIDYLINLRIREAKRLLAQKENRVYDVVEPAGFKDVKYFNRMFKKVTGLTPMEYREKHQSKGTPIDQERMI